MSEREAGRETDALVAERLGWTLSRRGHWWNGPDGKNVCSVEMWRPSAEITAAWELADRVFANTRSLDLDASLVLGKNGDQWEIRYRYGTAVARAETAPLCITRAFLAMTAPQEAAP